MTDVVMRNKIFNSDKTDYDKVSLILGSQDIGIFDTIHSQYPDVWALYMKQQSMDWRFNEFTYKPCIPEFKKCDKSQYQAMIYTLSWQMIGDSIASRNMAPVFAPFITSSEFWAAMMKNNEMENTHAAAYMEIVKGSFDDPTKAMEEIVKVRQAFDRTDTVMGALERTYITSHKYALGLVKNNQSTYNDAMIGLVALLLLERIQFLASFAVTFAICDTGMFQPIGTTIQKIAQDELLCHVELDRAVLRHELSTVRGIEFMRTHNELIRDMILSVVNGEKVWIDFLFSEGRSLVGLNPEILFQWVLYGAKDVSNFFNVDIGLKLPKTNPLKYMDKWIGGSSGIQQAAQERELSDYKIKLMTRDDSGVKFEVDF